MSRFSGLISRKPVAEGPSDKPIAESPVDDTTPAEAPDQDDNVLELDPELFAPIASRLGRDNEAVRNLLAEAEHRVGELDAVKQAVTKLVEPVSKTLRDFEVAKSERLSLQTVLNTTRVAYGKLRNEMNALEKRAGVMEGECTRLQDELSLAREFAESLEAAKSELTAQLAARQTEIADMKRRLQQDGAELQNAREENRRISERIAASDKKMVQLETDADAAKQRAMVAERERATLQAALDEALGEQSRISRRLAEADNALAASSTRLRQLESALSQAESDRTRLAQAADEAKEKHANEINTQRMRLDALHARAATMEKLLDEARHALAARAEEIRSYERRMSEAAQVRSMIEGKLGQIESGVAERDAQIQDLERTRAALTERNEVLNKAMATRENAGNRAQERIGSLEERIKHLEDDLKGSRESAELQIEELNTQLHRERVERTMAEGALDAAREDVSRLMRELAALQNRPAPPPEKAEHLPRAANLRVV